MVKVSSLSFDPDSVLCLDDLEHVLTPFGLFVYENPQYLDQNCSGFLISDTQLDDYDLAEIATEDYALDLDPKTLFDRDAHRTALLIRMNRKHQEKRSGKSRKR